MAEVNHCLTLEQVSDEIIEEYGIANGDYDTVKECKYNVPTETSIGRVYQMLIVSVSSNVEIEKLLKRYSHLLLVMKFRILILTYIIVIRII